MVDRRPHTVVPPSDYASPIKEVGRVEPRSAVEESTLPDRYRIKEVDGERILTCTEAPTVAVRVERGLSFTSSAARHAAPGSIFLDGAAQGEPFLDAKKSIYNLDHHEGCVRAFTLSTCEQALVLLRRGLDLRAREWKVYANEPDLDAVLAIWVLLNHMRLNGSDSALRQEITPLLRLEGAIDVHGLEMQDLCGFPPEFHRKWFARLEQLRQREVGIKDTGRWHEIDPLEYTAELLRTLDSMFYSPLDFPEVEGVEELARAELPHNAFAVACRSEAAIYRVEERLRRLYGDRLGVVILLKGPSTYTLRQTDPFLPASLEEIYDHLNRIDPMAGDRRSGNRWGGSAEIGGSPRRTGTGLTPQQIVQAFREVYREPSLVDRVAALARALATSGAVIGVAGLAVVLHALAGRDTGLLADLFRARLVLLAAILTLLSSALLWWQSHRGRGLFGLHRPTGLDWLALLPAAPVAAVLGGAWVPSQLFLGSEVPGLPVLAVALALPLAAEMLFRGVVHGGLIRAYQIQKVGGRWFLSWPAIASATLYTLWSLLPFLPLASPVAVLAPAWGLPSRIAGALLLGLACAMARERSESLIPPILLHLLSVAALLLVRQLSWI